MGGRGYNPEPVGWSRAAVRKWLSWVQRRGFVGRGWVNDMTGVAFVIATNDTPLADGYVRLGRRCPARGRSQTLNS